MEDNFLMDLGGGGGGVFKMIQVCHIHCVFYFYDLLHQLCFRSSGISSQSLGTPGLDY